MFKILQARSDLRVLHKLAREAAKMHRLKVDDQKDPAHAVSHTMGAMSAKIDVLERENDRLRTRKPSYPERENKAKPVVPEPMSMATAPTPSASEHSMWASRDMYPYPSGPGWDTKPAPEPFRAGGAVNAFAGAGATGEWDDGKNTSPIRSAALDNDIAAILGGVPLPTITPSTGTSGLVGIERLSEAPTSSGFSSVSDSDTGSSGSSDSGSSSSSDSGSSSSDT